MINADLIARSHFTRKADGKTSFETFKRAVGLQDEGLPFEYESKSLVNGTLYHFVIESWGGYESADGRWIIFAAWRCAASKVTTYIHWDWDGVNKKSINRRDNCFVS